MQPAPCRPISDALWPSEIADLRTGFAGGLNVYRTMAHHPDLLRAWVPLRQHVVKDSALGSERSEVVILRTAVRLGSQYEWSHHVVRARILGFSDKRIAAIRGEATGEDRLIVRAVDALVDQRRLDAELRAKLEPVIGTRGIIDLIATVGFYSVLGYLVMSFDTPLDADVAATLSQRPL
jgi:4-carboxymuconolactone decarboxylase